MGVASAAVAVALVVLVASSHCHRSSSIVEGTGGELEQAQDSSLNAGVDEPTAGVPPPPLAGDQNGTVTEAPSDTRTGHNVRERLPLDENTLREQLRRHAAKDIRDSYSLLLEDLGLAPEEKEALVALLIEINIAAMSTRYQRGTTMPEQERLDKIAAIISDPKLRQFLELERNLGEYWEVGRIGSLLQRNGAPATDTQRDGLMKILGDVHDQYTMPPSDDPVNSFARLEYHLTQLDEYDRHVVELIPSVLSPTQVVYVFEAYQRMAYQRADALERQKKQRAAQPSADLPLFYPGRWPE